MKSVLQVAGISKQSYYQHFNKELLFQQKLAALQLEVDILRTDHPGCGVEKMYDTLRPDFIGRDKFIDVFMRLGYRVRSPKRYQRTTIPVHSEYKNLITGLMVRDKNIVWQTDITYYQIESKFCYLVFIIDVYTKRILGFQASDHLRAEANLAALKMAFRNCNGSLEHLIHHSDRGSQYIDKRYTGLLKQKGILISMADKAQDNAYAERINGTIKNEYLIYWEPRTLIQLRQMLRKAVTHYNEKRIHDNLPNKMSPTQFEESLLNSCSQKRPTEIIYAEGNKKIKVALSRLDFQPKVVPQDHNCPMELY